LAIIPVLKFGESILRQKAKRVRNFDASLKKLADDMLETMRKASGVGLAAPQIGVPLRVIVIEAPGVETIIMANPEIANSWGEHTVTEGCLSYPGYRGDTKRAVAVAVKGFDLEGNKIRMRCEGLLSTAFQHEIDHLNGILYIDHLVNKKALYEIDGSEESEL